MRRCRLLLILVPMGVLLAPLCGGTFASADDSARDLVLTVVARPDAERLDVKVTLRVSPERSRHTFLFLRPRRVARVYDVRSGKDLAHKITPLDPKRGLHTLEIRGRTHRVGLDYSYDRSAYAGSSFNPATHDDLLLGQITPRSIFASHLFYYPFSENAPVKNAILRIQVPRGWMGVTSGRLASRKVLPKNGTLFEYVIEHDSGRLPYPLAIFPYVVTEGRYADRLPVSIYSSASDAKYAREKLKAVTDKVLPFLEDLMGPYPFRHLRIVEIFPTSGNVGLAAKGLVMLTQKMWFAAPFDGDFESDAGSVLIDELAHQWNYYKTPLPNYLAEGVSEYTDNLFLERHGDKTRLAQRMAEYRETYQRLASFLSALKARKSKGLTPAQTARELSVPIEEVKPLWPFADRGELPITDPGILPSLYFLKGALAVHALRKEMGDDAFFRGFRRLFEQSHDRPITIDQYRTSFEAFHTESLRPFFKRWYFATGLPK